MASGTQIKLQNGGIRNIPMKSFILICMIWLVASCPTWVSDQDKRFLEFPNKKDTVTYDLNTVQIIQPGKFTVIETTIRNPDVIKFELKVLDTLRTYCARALSFPKIPSGTDSRREVESSHYSDRCL
jgi:hypothetical protein